jgi:hypothetical protein
MPIRFALLSANGAAEIPKYSPPPKLLEVHKININLLQNWGSHVTLVKVGTREKLGITCYTLVESTDQRKMIPMGC